MSSPEVTGHYGCLSCGNTRSFVGYDDRGYPGTDECECGENVCECEVTLKQHFTVGGDDSIDYQAFEGGGRGAEIGAYACIQCAVCGSFIWIEALDQGAGKTSIQITGNEMQQKLIDPMNAIRRPRGAGE
jgi:hypothetical protein